MTDPANLQNLHDIVASPPVSWWPPAPGWYVLILVIFIVLIWRVWRWRKKWLKNAYRRMALSELSGLMQRLKNRADRVSALRDLTTLLKRTALATWPREDVARLSGPDWLDFLDRTGGTNEFSNGPGRLIPALAYGDTEKIQAIGEDQISELIQLIEHWVKNHHPPGNPPMERME